MIVADTGAIIALLDASDRHHQVLRDAFESDSEEWLLPWAILPEVDYLAATRLGDGIAQAFVADLADGAFAVEWGDENDLARAHALNRKYRALKLGLVDCVVMAVAERVGAEAIATLDVRDFSAVTLRGAPKLLPRDL